MSLWRGGFLALACLAAQVDSHKMKIDSFYSKSFLPNDLVVDYSVQDGLTFNYNLTVKMHFPGKLLIQVFVRKLDDVPGGENTFEMLKLKNMDFCKSLETLRNLTLDNYQFETLISPTFLMSCPLMPGFYYLEDATVDTNYMPWLIKDGRYFVLIELVQVYEEVTRLMNIKLKTSMKTPPAEPESNTEEASEDYSGDDGEK